jgi:peptidoglycan/xylan/chitin deacetylase (PgdA/CDA1 family)
MHLKLLIQLAYGIPTFSHGGGLVKTAAQAQLEGFPPVDPTIKANVFTQCTGPGMFALTFDDGVSQYTPKLLDTLSRNNVKATFFVNGKNIGDLSVQPYIEILQRAFADGHQIGSHTKSHSDITSLTDQNVWQEMKENDDLIENAIGVKPLFMRPPYGSYNAHSLALLGSWGYKVTMWNFDSRDFSSRSLSSSQFSSNQENQYSTTLAQSDNVIALHHDTVMQISLEFAQTLIDMVKEKGLRFVTIGECVGDGKIYR